MIEGQLIAQRYRLEEQLGAGGMGVVWRATDLELGRVVALKRSHDGDGGQIRREARIGAALQHPCVVTVYDAVVDGDDRWLVMEYLGARSLDEVVRTDGPLPVERVAAIGAHIASALAAMHGQDMVHRDVTPGNVLVAEDGTAKLTDLGISSWAEATLTGSAQVGGTAGYLAPEVARGEEAGPAADVFSLGATLFAALEGVSPWGSGEHGPFAQVHRAIDWRREPLRKAGALTGVIDALLSQRPAGRPSAEEARSLLTGETAALPVGRRPLARRRLLLGAGAAGAVVVVFAAVAFFVNRPPPQANAGHAQVGYVGDQHTADPCPLLSPNGVGQYGTILVEPNLGNFNDCDLDIDLPGDGNTVVDRLELKEPNPYAEVAVVPGQLSAIDRPAAKPDKCVRSFTLPDSHVVEVSAKRTDNKNSDQLCALVDPVIGDARDKVVAGPIPRRTYSFPAGSLANTDACTLLDGPTTQRFFGTKDPSDRYFGNWSCSWGTDAEGVNLYYSREYPLDHDPPDNSTRTTVGNRLAFRSPSSDGDECDMTIRYRTYTPVIPAIDGEPPQRDETVYLEYTDAAHKGDMTTICDTATSLATVVANRLPG